MVRKYDALRRQLAVFVEERCRLLDLRNECPFVASSAGTSGIEFAAYLPQFGGSKGMLLDVVTEPDYVPSDEHKRAANQLGVPISFVNPTSLFENANEFIEALRDWGYSGPPEQLRQDVRALLVPMKRN